VRRDLAIIKVHGYDLPAITLGNSDSLTVGEAVVIVGSPRGLEGTVTAGILSSVRASDKGFTVLQTDAAVNPGNSGGPLLNRTGQVVGVVSFKLRSAEGLNFALPINYARALLDRSDDPIALDEMRKRLKPSSPQTETNGPTLRETLDWLRQTLPLGNYAYTWRPKGDRPGSYRSRLQETVQLIPRSFSSCVVELDEVQTSDVGEHGVWTKWTSHYTIPLAELLKIVAGSSKTNPNDVISGPEWIPTVFLLAQSNAIVEHTSSITDEGAQAAPSTTTNLRLVGLRFPDQSLAERIQKAFDHAASLCRANEPF
jgi:hypothetical protein